MSNELDPTRRLAREHAEAADRDGHDRVRVVSSDPQTQWEYEQEFWSHLQDLRGEKES
jgi:hypothetical protein